MSQLTDSNGALVAMKVAAEKARERAARFGSKLAVWRNGSVTLIDPKETKVERGAVEKTATRSLSK